MFYKIFIMIFLCITYNIISSVPYSFSDSLNQLSSIEQVDKLRTEIPNIEAILSYSDSLDEIGIIHPEFFGKGLEFNIKLNENGVWDTLSNGDRVWRLNIICPNAFTINFELESVFIGLNSNISFYSEDKNSLLGPYTQRINRVDSLFSTHLINSQSTIIELYESLEDFGKNSLVVSKVIYGFKDISSDANFSKQASIQSAYCHIDANCPEGDEYCREKYSITRILKPYNNNIFALCSGSLLNNTAEDYKPLLLTAFHCIDDGSGGLAQSEKDEANNWVIQFGYIRENCESGSSMQTFEYFGAEFLAGWNQVKTDFVLLELLDNPKSGENNFPDVFYNGWDRTGDIPNNVGGLHHPDGDYMKVSLDSDQPSTYNTYWWSVDGWDNGTTEPISSGSPLFNEDRRVVGQLTGQKHRGDDPRQAPCEFNKESTYGKLSLSWEGGGTSDTRLKDWLDPINSGVTTLDGIKMPNLQFGWVFPNLSVTHYAAYTDMQIGSNSTSSYKVEAGAELSLKAGREIKISPCTQIRAGSEFHAYIQNPDCDDIVPLSDKITDHNPNICSTYPKLVKEDQDFNSAYIGNTFLTISPNPVTSISDIKLTVGSADNVSLMLYDNLGNQRYSYLDNISLKSGTYNYKLDGNELNSGMFVLVLKIDGIIVTEKVINLK